MLLHEASVTAAVLSLMAALNTVAARSPGGSTGLYSGERLVQQWLAPLQVSVHSRRQCLYTPGDGVCTRQAESREGHRSTLLMRVGREQRSPSSSSSACSTSAGSSLSSSAFLSSCVSAQLLRPSLVLLLCAAVSRPKDVMHAPLSTVALSMLHERILIIDVNIYIYISHIILSSEKVERNAYS